MMKVLKNTMDKNRIKEIKDLINTNKQEIRSLVKAEFELREDPRVTIRFQEYKICTLADKKELELYVTPFEEYIEIDSEYSGVDPLVFTV